MTHNKELFCRVKDVLLREWDPVGIADIPEAHDEYDIYINEIINVISQKEPRKLVKYLCYLERHRMGMNPYSKDTHIRLYSKLCKVINKENKEEHAVIDR